MKKKILSILLCFSVLVCMFSFSFSASADYVSGSETFPWVHYNNYKSHTIWWLANRSAGGDVLNLVNSQEIWPNGTWTGETTLTYPISKNGQEWDSFRADLQLCTKSQFHERVYLPPGYSANVVISGQIRGESGIIGTRYSSRVAMIQNLDFNNPITRYLTPEGDSVVSPIDDYTASFHVSANLNNKTDEPMLIGAVSLIFDTSSPFTSLTFNINAVRIKYTAIGVSVEQDYGSVDNSTDDTIIIDGFFSFLNKPLNMFLDIYRKIGAFIWSKIPSSLQNMIQSGTAFFGGFWDSFISSIRSFISDPLGSISSVAHSIFDTVKSGLDALKSAISSLASAIWDILPDWLKNTLTAIFNFVRDFYGGIAQAFVDFFSDPLGIIGDFLSGVFDWVKRIYQFITNTTKALGTGVSFIVTSLSTWWVVAGYVPAIIGGCMIAVIALAIIKFILEVL